MWLASSSRRGWPRKWPPIDRWATWCPGKGREGKDIDRRLCPIHGKVGVCPPCYPCGVVSGLGGAGAFSDGKLTLSPHVGGRLVDYLGLGRTEELIKHVDSLYLRFGAEDRVYGVGEGVEAFRKKASLAEL